MDRGLRNFRGLKRLPRCKVERLSTPRFNGMTNVLGHARSAQEQAETKKREDTWDGQRGAYRFSRPDPGTAAWQLNFLSFRRRFEEPRTAARNK